MKLFPTKNLKAKLTEDCSIALAELKQNTDITDSLVSSRTKKAFRGQVSETEFKIISSEIGTGSICVLTGKFDGTIGEIEVKIHKAFKVMFSILLSYPFIGFGLICFNEGFEKAVEFLPTLLIGLLFIRFVFIELSFNIISKIGLNKLTKIMRIEKLIKQRGTTSFNSK
ncbi:hypothetical protein [Gillisia limnaea]|uniref:Uncharacterized protein n=1 Tax=Gillisia limnaea (strain DSM 15749 / LMG 21470 / R-8282) TaxID=865937 RepID=H2BTI0_GILLR|nr:hypothetical protein [Gillisia limnaea]EHQ01566.1 hypothetical protein Gilli_0877 [Gillisia limnaea DSM 15749]